MKLTVVYISLLLIHVLATLWLSITPGHAAPYNSYYNLAATLFFLLPMLRAMRDHKQYPELRPIFVFWILSFLAPSIAQLIWSYSNLVSHISLPTPGIGDLFFLAYYPFQFILLLNISKSHSFTWNTSLVLSFVLLSLIFTFFTTSFLFTNINLSSSGVMGFLSFIYPTCDSILAAYLITMVGSQKSPPLRYLNMLTAAYVLILISDVIFAYRTGNGTYWIGGPVDLLYVFAHFLLALSAYYFPLGTKPILF